DYKAAVAEITRLRNAPQVEAAIIILADLLVAHAHRWNCRNQKLELAASGRVDHTGGLVVHPRQLARSLFLSCLLALVVLFVGMVSLSHVPAPSRVNGHPPRPRRRAWIPRLGNGKLRPGRPRGIGSPLRKPRS